MKFFFMLPPPEGQRYFLSVSAPGYGKVSDQEVRPPLASPGGRMSFPDIVLPSADQSVAGVVVDPQGRPLPRIAVAAKQERLPPGERLFMYTDAKGRFSFSGLCRGPVGVSAMDPPNAGSLQVNAGDLNVKIVLTQQTEEAYPE